METKKYVDFEYLKTHQCYIGGCGPVVLLSDIYRAPCITIDVAPVVHGAWKLSFDRQSGGGLVEYFECSHCKYDVGKLKPKWNYCPRCEDGLIRKRRYKMILCAALRIKDTNTVIGCCRHGDGYTALHDLRPEIRMAQVDEGFINDKGEFLTREEALDHAFLIGQLSMTTYQVKHEHREKELYSEDLW